MNVYTLWQLLLAFVKIGALSFGGGYAALPLIQEYVVDAHGWMSLADFTNLITISQMTPGPIAINAATFIGNAIAGIPGAIIATLGVILPSVLLVTVLTLLYYRYRELSILRTVLDYLRPSVVALIAVSAVTILLSSLFGEVFQGLDTVRLNMLIIFVLSLFLLHRQRPPVQVMIIAGLANALMASFF